MHKLRTNSDNVMQRQFGKLREAIKPIIFIHILYIILYSLQNSTRFHLLSYPFCFKNFLSHYFKVVLLMKNSLSVSLLEHVNFPFIPEGFFFC